MTLFELTGVRSVERVDDTRVAFDGVFGADPSEDCPFYLEFLDTDVVVLHLDPFTKTCSYSPYTDFDVEPDGDVSVSIEETDETAVVSSSDLSVRVDLESGSFEVHRESGEELFTTSPDTVDIKGNVKAKNFGFTTEQVNRNPDRVTETHVALSLDPDENVYGGGEQKGDPNKRGDVTTAWVTQAAGSTSRATYKAAPFFVSDKDYGIYVDTTAKTSFDFGCSAPGATGVTVESDALSLVVFDGDSMKDVLKQYTAATGRPPRMPKWTYGLWTSRNTYESAEQTREIAQGYRDRSLPCDVIHLDPGWLTRDEPDPLQWDTDSFPDPEGLIEDLHDQGFKLCLWEFPYLQLGNEDFERAAERDFLVNDEAGRPYIYWDRGDYKSENAIVDFTNPEASEWWTQLHVDLLEMGVDVFKADFGEYLPEGSIMADGTSMELSRNRYPQLYQESILAAFERTDTDPVFWSRSGWAGGQKYAIHWNGDAYSTWEGFRTSLEMGLSISLSGYVYWSCDSGGYKPTPTPELYTRWIQWSLLGNSHTRVHGKSPREPWAYGEEAEAAVHNVLNERYRLIPYIYTYGNEAADTGIPLLRPMVLENEDDVAVTDLHTQHYLGPDLLVAPVLSKDDTVDVYLPEGTWYDYWTGETHEGPTTIEHRDYPFDRIPVYVPAGTVLPLQERPEHLATETYEPITLALFDESGGSTLLTNPETGEQEDVEVTVENGSVTISASCPLSELEIVGVELSGGDGTDLSVPEGDRDATNVTIDR